MREYESILAKARKLAAVADPKNGASAGEVENASNALHALLARHKITLESISSANRVKRGVRCVTMQPKHRPGKDTELAKLCAQCLRYVTGHSGHHFECSFDTVAVVGKKKKGKTSTPSKSVKIYAVFAEVTDLEYKEWCEAFLHYAGALKDSLAALRKEVRIAQKAVTVGYSGFINRHGIFPADAEVGDTTPDRDSLMAFMKAYQGAQGTQWKRKAGYLQEEFLLQ